MFVIDVRGVVDEVVGSEDTVAVAEGVKAREFADGWEASVDNGDLDALSSKASVVERVNTDLLVLSRFGEIGGFGASFWLAGFRFCHGDCRADLLGGVNARESEDVLELG